MMIRPRPWTQHLRRALTSPGNLIAGAGAVLAAAVTWNPLPLILYGLGEPVWLYTATSSQRYARRLRDERRAEAAEGSRRQLAWREHQLAVLLHTTPCGLWTRRGQLPDYARTYGRLVEMRDQAAQIASRRHDAANALEQDIIARMDDMLRAYLLMARERLLLACSLARIYPQLPEPPAAEPLPSLLGRIKRALIVPEPAGQAPLVAWREDTRLVSLDDARDEVRGKLAGFARDIERAPSLEEVYRPMIEVLERRQAELDARAANDLTMAAQLQVFPEQFELILNKLATSHADVGEVIGDMKLLLEQTDDTVRFAEDVRAAERPTLVSN
ncbi:MAG TPA: hypothetical protein VFT22_27055 [Kofleriaceae bacterium]|nr:hypothetical protein [Kofleriaceae bacterium]